MSPEQKKLQRAKVGLMLEEPFFGHLLISRLTWQEDRTGQVTTTMATDGERLIWSTDAVKKWSEAEIRTVLAHEAMHCALLHPLRRGARDPKKWNVACDYAVNSVLEQCNLDAKAKSKTPPFSWPTDPEPLLDMALAGKSVEEIYASMPDPPPGGGGGDGQGKDQGQGKPDSMGDVLDAPAKDQASKDSLEASWKQAAVEAAAAAKGRGQVPASMQQVIDEILNPKVSWREVLRRFVRDRAADDYSWTRPNSRYAGTGFILPSLHSQRLGPIAIIRDTSGSTQSWQAEILAELAGIISETRPSKVILIDADAAVQRVLELEPDDTLPGDQCGGGGTDFCPALAALADRDNIMCAIYLTDLAGTFPDQEPGFPVLWATDSSDVAPFGETIRVQ